MSEQCPHCRVGPRQVFWSRARVVTVAIGCVAGAIRGASVSGTKADANSPLSLIASAVLGCLVGGATGCAAGSALGTAVDRASGTDSCCPVCGQEVFGSGWG